MTRKASEEQTSRFCLRPHEGSSSWGMLPSQSIAGREGLWAGAQPHPDAKGQGHQCRRRDRFLHCLFPFVYFLKFTCHKIQLLTVFYYF